MTRHYCKLSIPISIDNYHQFVLKFVTDRTIGPINYKFLASCNICIINQEEYAVNM